MVSLPSDSKCIQIYHLSYPVDPDCRLYPGVAKQEKVSIIGLDKSVCRQPLLGHIKGFDQRGVTMMSNSVSPRSYELLRNRAPRMGSSPRSGNLVDHFPNPFLQEASDGKALSISQFNHGRSASDRQAGYARATQCHGVGKI